ncbi:hypothetical protein DL89DRAFT_181921 [Linderina pennispora]|uniref:BRCT domain-containing protein n=1 Tax=Linderina pennispora TaxID=61395 RepID=A0A1Y1W546_9FUNG|nr:uncharacterized protein DL89DRAFT_181921 [Linderina pennispora]ORX68673.1 hypothetical protein DL89DRAFT_181921 [Linderina pennispora]
MPAEFQLLKGFCISCSGFNVNEKNDIHRRVDQLGGKTCTGLTTSVTQLVMKTIDAQSKKYRASEKASIPVVSLDFITECEYEASRRRKTVYDEDDVAGIVSEITERARLSPFAGCRICTTGFSVEQREEIKRLVTTRIDHNDILYKNYADGQLEILTIGGLGSYHGELTPDCTHLIAASLTGQKCKYGRLWDVSIVSFEWFRKSVATGFRQDESKFALVSRAPESPSQTPGSQGQRTPQSAMRSDSMQPSMVPQTRASDVEPDFSFCSDADSRPVTRNRTAAGSMTTDSYDLPPGLTGPLDIDDDEL